MKYIGDQLNIQHTPSLVINYVYRIKNNSIYHFSINTNRRSLAYGQLMAGLTMFCKFGELVKYET